jgi:hypothetical protein
MNIRAFVGSAIGCLSSILPCHAHEKVRDTVVTDPVIFSSLEGKPWVEQCLARHPEIAWLADGGVRKTEEGQATSELPYSEQIYSQKFVEFDRTIMTIHCLRLILDGSERAYQTFVADQPANVKLSRASFQLLHTQGQSLLKSEWGGLTENELALAMETALVLGDMGKSPKARQILQPYGISAPDQDDFYGEAVQVLHRHPELSTSFAQLPENAQALLVQIANMAHYGHITHLEGDIGMFTHLRESGIPRMDSTALSFDLFVHLCDVAGALGHVNKQSSVAYTELTHRALQAMAESVKVLCNPQKTEWDAFNTCLEKRASWLGLNPSDPTDRVLARIGAMLRLFSEEEGVVLKTAMLELNESVRDRIADQLNVQEVSRPGRTPTYMPAMLVNLSNNKALGSTWQERLAAAIKIGLPFMAKVLEQHQELLATEQMDPTIPLNFNTMAGLAKTAPEKLAGEATIDKQGIVLIQSN